MKILQNFTFKLSIFTGISAFSSSAYAGTPNPNIVYGPVGPANIPTLSGAMLVILSLLLFVVAIRVTKQKGKERSKFFITLLGASTLITGISGVNIISDADAVAAPGSISLTVGTSGKHTELFYLNVINTVTNNSTPALPIKIFEINYAGCPNNPIDNSCSVGTILPVGANCKIDCEQEVVVSCETSEDCSDGQICTNPVGSELGGICTSPDIL